jgi:hypothetical protein
MSTNPRETASLPSTVNPVERLASLMGADLAAVDVVIHARMLRGGSYPTGCTASCRFRR